MVVTAAGENSVTDFAGYHDVFTDSSGATVYYAVVPYPSGTLFAQPLTPLQQATVVLSHEVSEAITDPDTGSGWLDPHRGEIGDITAGQIGILQGYAVQAVWSQVDGKAVIPAGTSAMTLPSAGGQVHASAGPSRNMAVTRTDADARAAFAGFMAVNGSFTASSATGGQGGQRLAQSQEFPVERFGSVAVAGSSGASATVAVSPSTWPDAMSLRLSQVAATDGGGGDNRLQILQDELPAAGSAVPGEEAFPPPAVPGFEEVPAMERSPAALWREASTAYFAEQSAAHDPAKDCLPAPGTAVDGCAAGSSGAATAALALLLSGSWSHPAHEPAAHRRRPAPS